MLVLTRTEVGRRLAMGLVPVLGTDAPVVVGITPGGVRVAAEIARLFEVPLDVLPACRLEVPGRAHSTFGAIAGGATLLLPGRVSALNLPEDYVGGLIARAREEVAREARAWRGEAAPVPLRDQTVILADDGTAERVMLRIGASGLRELGARRVILAVPTVTPECLDDLRPVVDSHVILFEPGLSPAVRVQDRTFEQVTGADVSTLVRRSRPEHVVNQP